ncbi:hypothetical protein BJ165DRAFT_1527844 [Panaeolus papilionaceus]|nr:hypothetical protein BJ165DRAFT_1527844 [Panaeolus papilionaceus]
MSYSSDNIIASRNPDAPLGALDGQVAAQMEHRAVKYIITTPNQDHIPVPPIGEVICVFVPTSAMVLRTIPNGLSFISYHRVFWAGESVTEKGGTTSTYAIRTSRFSHAILSSDNPSQKTTEVLTSFRFQMCNTVERLAALAMPFNEIMFNVTEFQCIYLSLDAMLRYRSVYQPRLNNPNYPPPHVQITTLWCLYHERQCGATPVSCRVPVWFIQEWDGTPLRRNILHVVDIVMPCPPFRLGDHSPPFPTIFRGLMSDARRYTSICTYSLRRQLSPDPFARGDNGTASVLASTSSTSAWVAPSNPVPHITVSNTQGPNRPPKAKKKKQEPNQKVAFTGRNKFEPLEHACAPYSIPAWRDALSTVDYSPARIVDRASADHNSNQYIFPDPGLFMNSKHMDIYILNWLRINRVWFLFVAENGTFSPQDWRHLLFLDFSNPPPDGDSPTIKRRRELYEMLQTRGNQFSGLRLVDRFSTAPTWNGQPVTAPVPEKTAREIMWTLYEFNFTFELISLDRRACIELGPNPTEQKLEEREKLIRACFAPARFKMPEVDPENIGLASNKLEDRLPYIIALGKVVKSWTLNPDPVLLLCDHRRPELHLDEPRRHGLERVVTQLYCQTFWNYFGRAAQIPHRLHQ